MIIPTPSLLSNLRFALTPRANPPIEPSDFITLWHGTGPGYGFLFRAFPTALAAPGEPDALATHA